MDSWSPPFLDPQMVIHHVYYQVELMELSPPTLPELMMRSDAMHQSQEWHQPMTCLVSPTFMNRCSFLRDHMNFPWEKYQISDFNSWITFNARSDPLMGLHQTPLIQVIDLGISSLMSYPPVWSLLVLLAQVAWQLMCSIRDNPLMRIH